MTPLPSRVIALDLVDEPLRCLYIADGARVALADDRGRPLRGASGEPIEPREWRVRMVRQKPPWARPAPIVLRDLRGGPYS